MTVEKQNSTQNIKQHIEIIIQKPDTSALDHLYDYIHSQLTPQQPAFAQLSKQKLKNYALKGAIWLTESTEPGESTKQRQKPKKTERLRRLKKQLKLNDKIDFYYNADLLESSPPTPTLIEDFEAYSVWLKPRGMLSQGSKWADHTALYRWVEMNYKPNNQTRQAWIVHRLDRATQGLMLLAHTKKMATTLSQYFESGKIHKIYQANVWGTFPQAPKTVNLAVDGKPATSHISRLDDYPKANISRVRIEIETGRKHQIRSHLSQIGFPIVGDRLYGNGSLDGKFTKIPDLQLTAFSLLLACPINKTQQVFELTSKQLDLLTF